MEQLTAQIVTSVLVAAVIFVPIGYALAKRKLKALISCLQEVDKAIEDDNVSQEEVEKIWEACSKLWKKE